MHETKRVKTDCKTWRIFCSHVKPNGEKKGFISGFLDLFFSGKKEEKRNDWKTNYFHVRNWSHIFFLRRIFLFFVKLNEKIQFFLHFFTRWKDLGNKKEYPEINLNYEREVVIGREIIFMRETETFFWELFFGIVIFSMWETEQNNSPDFIYSLLLFHACWKTLKIILIEVKHNYERKANFFSIISRIFFFHTWKNILLEKMEIKWVHQLQSRKHSRKSIQIWLRKCITKKKNVPTGPSGLP